jgi:hypothetical protein
MHERPSPVHGHVRSLGSEVEIDGIGITGFVYELELSPQVLADRFHVVGGIVGFA